MKEEKIKAPFQVFICNHKTCEEKGSRDLTDKLKKWSKEETNKEVKVFRSGCLGQCDDGIAIACFPEKKFILEVEKKDFTELSAQFKDKWQKLSREEN